MLKIKNLFSYKIMLCKFVTWIKLTTVLRQYSVLISLLIFVSFPFCSSFSFLALGWFYLPGRLIFLITLYIQNLPRKQCFYDVILKYDFMRSHIHHRDTTVCTCTHPHTVIQVFDVQIINAITSISIFLSQSS